MNQIRKLVRRDHRASLVFLPCEDPMKSHQSATQKQSSLETDLRLAGWHHRLDGHEFE